MRFKEFITEVVPSEGDFKVKKLSAAEAIDFMDNECHNYLERVKSTPIFRGMYEDGTVAYKNTNDFTRRSANTANIYTLWIDNDRDWAKFPKRSKSLVCSTSANTATDYGTLHLIIPTDKSLVGVCPRPDIWDSFEATKMNANGDYESHGGALDEFVHCVMRAFDLLDFEQKTLQVEWPKLVEALKATTLKKLQASPGWKIGNPCENKLLFWLRELGPTMYDVFEETFNPHTNGFKVMKASDLKAGMNKEVWVQGEVIVLDVHTVEHRLGDEARKLDDYLKSHGIDMQKIGN